MSVSLVFFAFFCGYSFIQFAPVRYSVESDTRPHPDPHEPAALRVTDPRSGPRLCEAQRFMAPTHVHFLEVSASHEPPLSRPSATLSPPCGERVPEGRERRRFMEREKLAQLWETFNVPCLFPARRL